MLGRLGRGQGHAHTTVRVASRLQELRAGLHPGFFFHGGFRGILAFANPPSLEAVCSSQV